MSQKLHILFKLAEQFEEQAQTLRNGDPYLISKSPSLLPLSNLSLPSSELESLTDSDPYHVGLQALNVGPTEREYDQEFSQGCRSLEEKLKHLETLSRIGAATVGTRNSHLIYDFKSDISLVSLLKQIKATMANIQALYEELP